MPRGEILTMFPVILAFPAGGKVAVTVGRTDRPSPVWRPHRGRTAASPVGVSSMADIHYEDLRLGVVDHVSHAVLATSSAPVAFEWPPQGRADPLRVLREGAVEELDTSSRHRVGKLLGRLTGGGPGDHHPVGHSSTDRCAARRARTSSSSRTSPRTISACGLPNAALSLGVTEQFQGRLDRLEIRCGHQHDKLPAVSCDVHPFVGATNLIGDLRQLGLCFGQGNRGHRPEL